MTREQIAQMPAGREIDRLIARKVMGWSEINLNGYEHWEIEESSGDSLFVPVDSFRPSSNLHDAWQVKKRMTERHMVHDWESIFVELTCWKWFLLSEDAFCLGASRAALIVTTDS